MVGPVASCLFQGTTNYSLSWLISADFLISRGIVYVNRISQGNTSKNEKEVLLFTGSSYTGTQNNQSECVVNQLVETYASGELLAGWIWQFQSVSRAVRANTDNVNAPSL
jgi:hypothetical protein